MAAEADSLRLSVISKTTEKLPQCSSANIEEYVFRAEEYFKAYTKRTEVPERAFYLWVDLSIAFYNEQTQGSAAVSSIKRGDTTINYSSSVQLTNVSALNDKLKSYRVVISK